MKRLVRLNIVLITALLVISGCSSGSSNSDKKDNSNHDKDNIKEEKIEFNQDTMDKELFTLTSESGVSEDDINQIRKEYDYVKGLWNLTTNNLLTETHYMDLKDDKFVLETILFMVQSSETNEFSQFKKIVPDNSVVLGSSPDVEYYYVTLEDALILVNQYFGRSLNIDTVKSQTYYEPSLDGFLLIGGIGGVRFASLNDVFTISRYQDTYVLETKYSGEQNLSGTFYMVFKKIVEDGSSRYIYRWTYTQLDDENWQPEY